MKKNQHIEALLQKADKLAKTKKHEYVTTEHMLVTMVGDKEFRNILIEYGVQVSDLETELLEYIDSKYPQVDKDPKRSHILEKTFNRAYTQVLFSGRDQLNTFDIFLAIMAEDNTMSQYFIMKYNIERESFVSSYRKTMLLNYVHKKKKFTMIICWKNTVLT